MRHRHCPGEYIEIFLYAFGTFDRSYFLSNPKTENDHSFKFLWLTIVLSFGFYIPVVLFADSMPIVGALMVPKRVHMFGRYLLDTTL